MDGPAQVRSWLRISLAVKLAASLVVSTAGLFILFGYLNLRLQRQHSQEMVLQSAERISDLIQRSTRYLMLRNDREALYQVITTIGNEPGIRRVRIFNEEGRITLSTDPQEINKLVDKQTEACYGCHAPEKKLGEPLTGLARSDRARIFTDAHGEHILGVIRPIENEPACSNGSCHAHPADRRILGVIDADLSLAAVDARLAEHQAQLSQFTGLAIVLISGLSMVFIWLLVYRPVQELTTGTRKVAEGDLAYRLPVHTGPFHTQDELGDLAASFNKMTEELAAAHGELTAWARTLEDRVDEKTRELRRAHEHVLKVEKMASIGKLAAVVAHEINNPLAGILTYTKLLKKWLARGDWESSRREEVRSSLDLVESEIRRCGEIVKNLLTFSRAAPMNLEWTDVNLVVERVVRLVLHQLELASIQLRQELTPTGENGLPRVHCDPAQLQQVLLALVLNAIDAMPRGGNLSLRSRAMPAGGPPFTEVQLEVGDDGMGIPPELLPKLFEPFFTTKERGRGVGLGLAISKSILERHGGNITVASEPGRGTRFTLTLPVVGPTGAAATPSEKAAPAELAATAPARRER
jgi:two-component system NtrC family sensor kinase